MQDHRDHSRRQAGRTLDRQIDRARRFPLDPVAEAAECPVSSKCRANAGAERVEGRVTVGALYDSLYLGTVPIVEPQGRERHLRFSGFAVAQDQQAIGRHAFWQDLAAQGGCGQCCEPCVQRGEDSFTGRGYGRLWLIFAAGGPEADGAVSPLAL